MHESIETYLTHLGIRIAKLEHDQKIAAEILKLYPNVQVRNSFIFHDSSVKPTDVEHFLVADGEKDCILFCLFVMTNFGKVYYTDQFKYQISDYTKDYKEKIDNSDFWQLIQKANLPEELIAKIKETIKDEDDIDINDFDEKVDADVF